MVFGSNQRFPPPIQAPNKDRSRNRPSPQERFAAWHNQVDFQTGGHQRMKEITMKRYIALIHKDKDSDYGIIFPDFPGCASVGETMEEAVENGREALAFHVESMQQDGETVPTARTLEAIKAAREDWIDFKDAVVVWVALLPAKGKSVRVNVNIDRNLLAAADVAAERANQTRSAFIARAIESAIRT